MDCHKERRKTQEGRSPVKHIKGVIKSRQGRPSESAFHCIYPKVRHKQQNTSERALETTPVYPSSIQDQPNPTKMHEKLDIKAVLQLEEELNSSPAPSIERDAKVNLLKYLQISTVKKYEADYDGLFYELNKDGGLERLRNITPARSKGNFLQPKVYDLQGCDEAANLGVLEQAEYYLADAKLAKLRLDELIEKVVENLEGCEVRYAEVKSRESTVRKAKKSYDGNVRRVADMARVAVVCETAELLEQVYMGITGHLQPQDVLRVSNGFISDWMPSGYRDVKVNAIVNEHLCEIQLQLGAFFCLKAGQHAVYEWARDLNVTTEIEAEHIFKNLSEEVTKEMVCLAQQNWGFTEKNLPKLHLAAGDYLQAQEGLDKMLSEAEEQLVHLEENSEEWRRAVLAEATTRSILGHVMALQGKFPEAEPLYQQSLATEERVLGPGHPAVAASLNHLAALLKSQGKYAEAKPLYKRALAVQEKTLGQEHPAVASSLNNLAGVLKNQGDYAEAEPLYTRSLAIREKVLGPEHPDVAFSLNDLAALLDSQGKYAEAEPLFKRSLAIREKVLGPEHPDVASSLNNLAGLLQRQGKYAEAEPLHEQSLAIQEKTLGPEHPEVASSLSNLAALLDRQGKCAEAEPLYKRALAVREKTLGSEHPDVASSLSKLAGLWAKQGNYAEAEPLYQRSLAIGEKALGPEHPAVATSLNNLAGLLDRQGKFTEAEALYKRSLFIREKTLGSEHPAVASSLSNLAVLLGNQSKFAEAEPLCKRSLAIQEKSLGPEHPALATLLINSAGLLKRQGKYVEAGLLYKRSLAIQEKALGPEHPDMVASLNNWAVLLKSQGKFAEAEPLYKRALAIHEKVLGSENPSVASLLNNLAELLDSQGKYEEAEPLFKRSIAIFEAALGSDHPDLAALLINWAALLHKQGKHNEALTQLQRALAIRTRTLGEGHEDTISAQEMVEIVGKQVCHHVELNDWDAEEIMEDLEFVVDVSMLRLVQVGADGVELSLFNKRCRELTINGGYDGQPMLLCFCLRFSIRTPAVEEQIGRCNTKVASAGLLETGRMFCLLFVETALGWIAGDLRTAVQGGDLLGAGNAH